MSKFQTLKLLYQRGGFSSISKRIYRKILKNNTVSNVLKTVFGQKIYHKILLYPHLGYWPKIDTPRTFNEKITHRKIYSDKDLFCKIEDKWAVREYVSEKVGKKILPEVYYVTDQPDTIPFNTLPEEFVIKPTHLSGPVLIIDGDEYLTNREIRKQCKDWLSRTHGVAGDEYWYSGIEPQIMVEELLHDSEHGAPLDFKFFVFHGKVEYIQVDFGRFSEHTRRFYNREWDPQDFTLKYPLGPNISKPNNLNEMIEIAEKLGNEFNFIRVDLYSLDGEQIVFGEMTVAHGSGEERFVPRCYDFKFGSLW